MIEIYDQNAVYDRFFILRSLTFWKYILTSLLLHVILTSESVVSIIMKKWF